MILFLLTGVPTDSHSEDKGEGAESTDYGSDYVSGGNSLKFGQTPLSGEYCFIYVIRVFDANDHKHQ